MKGKFPASSWEEEYMTLKDVYCLQNSHQVNTLQGWRETDGVIENNQEYAHTGRGKWQHRQILHMKSDFSHIPQF